MSEYHVEEHYSPVQNAKQLIAVVVLSFVIPVITLVMLASIIVGTPNTSQDNPALNPEAVAKRLQPVGQVVVADASSAGGAAKSGEEVVKTVCAACHAAGVLGAPKIGDKASWAPHIKMGLEHLTHNAIAGIRQMPARGGDSSLSDLEIARAIVYMANQSGASFKEPAAPAAAPAGDKVKK
jgi:cytochrome c5